MCLHEKLKKQYFSALGWILLGSARSFQKTVGQAYDDDIKLICSILARTEYTKRKVSDLVSEWYLHNIYYNEIWCDKRAQHVDLDYNRDPRAAIVIATKIVDIIGWG